MSVWETIVYIAIILPLALVGVILFVTLVVGVWREEGTSERIADFFFYRFGIGRRRQEKWLAEYRQRERERIEREVLPRLRELNPDKDITVEDILRTRGLL